MLGTKKTVDTVVNVLFDNKKQKLNKKQLIKRIAKLPSNEQSKITNVGNKGLFTTGWRPFLGWVCTFNLLYLVCIRDIAIMLNLPGFGAGIMSKPVGLDMTMELVIILLGFGGLRTFEKVKRKD